MPCESFPGESWSVEARSPRGHLLLASGMTAYVLIGLYFEERDLVRNFGERYRAYQKSTPKLIPLLTRKTRPGMAVVDE